LGRTLAGHEIAAAVMVKLNQPALAKMAMTARVQSNLTYLKKQGKVAKVGDKQNAKWTLASEPRLF
jgi:hypothetical protein